MAKKIDNGQVLVRALIALGGGGGSVQAGDEYYQPQAAAEFMAAQGWVVIVDAPPAVEVQAEQASE